MLLNRLLRFTTCLLFSAVSAVLVSCAGGPEEEASPTVKIERARTLIDTGHITDAKTLLEDLRAPLAGTAQEEEVQFLLAEARFGLEEFADAEVLYGSFLARFPGSRHAPEALFKRALAFIRQTERLRIGFFSLRTVVPYDRDVEPLAQAEDLLAEYLRRWPDGSHAAEASGWKDNVREKRGLHELEVASYYLQRGNTAAAEARARRVAEGDFPASVKEKAAGILGRLPSHPPPASTPPGTTPGKAP